ncbi:MAG TPA: hypothetical protein VLI06_06340, partial [Solimonas sp.]|nr:hypothetical protein [Solimonas sp.]
RALREQRNLRWVGRAVLRGAQADSSPPLRFALEDALNSADFGDAGRLILVRRLALGKLSGGIQGPALARAIERAWRELARQALHALHPTAAQAPAVWFRSAAEAQLLWLQRCMARSDPPEWFWPLALPRMAELPPPGLLVNVLATLCRDAPSQLQSLLHASSLPALRSLLLQLPPTPPAELVASQPQMASGAVAVAWRAGPAAAVAAAGPSQQPDARLQPAATPMLVATAETQALRIWQACIADTSLVQEDWRLSWVARQAARHPAVLAQLQTAGFTATASPSETAAVAVAGPAASGASPSPGDAAMNAGHQAVAAPRANLQKTDGARLVMTAALDTQAGVRRPSLHSQLQRSASALPTWFADAAPTRCAGLLFLLNALPACGFDRWLQAQPRNAAAGLLDLLAQRLRMPGDDPLRQLWQPAVELSPETRTALHSFHFQLRRSLRRHARLGLWSLVHRRGWLVCSDTHADLLLPLSEIDLRVRRTGLDCNPGWVPWFGRIVSFHYLPDAEPRDG